MRQHEYTPKPPSFTTMCQQRRRPQRTRISDMLTCLHLIHTLVHRLQARLVSSSLLFSTGPALMLTLAVRRSTRIDTRNSTRSPGVSSANAGSTLSQRRNGRISSIFGVKRKNASLQHDASEHSRESENKTKPHLKLSTNIDIKLMTSFSSTFECHTRISRL